MAANSLGATINLLPQEMRETGKIRALRRLLRRGSFVFLGVYLLATVLLFAVYFFLSQRAGTLSNANSGFRAKIESLKSVEGGLVVLHDRLRLAQSVFAQASGPQQLVEEVLSLFPPSVQITEVKAAEGTITLSALSPTSGGLSEVFSKLEDSKYKTVVLKSLSTSSEGGYSLSLEIH